MDAKLQRRVQRYGWDAAAETYDVEWRDNLRAAHDAMFEACNVSAGQQVLDLACGTGFLTFRLADIVGSSGAVTATDLSQVMVDVTSRHAERLGATNVEVERMDAEALTFADDSFNACFCGLGLMYAPDPGQAMREMARVLKPGGAAVISVWGERAKCGWADIFPIVDARVASEVCPLFFRLGTRDALALELASAGFTDISTKRLSSNLCYDNEKAIIAAQIYGGAVALAAKRFSAEVREKVEAEFLASVAAYRAADGRYAIPGEFVVSVARAP